MNKSTPTISQAITEYHLQLKRDLLREKRHEEQVLSYTRRQITCLAENIYREARGQSRKGQMAVALVTMNRVKHHFARTVCGVVHEPGQFSWVGEPRPSFEPWQWLIAKHIAWEVYMGRIHDFTQGALYFYAADDPNPPAWATEYQQTIEAGNQIFLRP